MTSPVTFSVVKTSLNVIMFLFISKRSMVLINQMIKVGIAIIIAINEYKRILNWKFSACFPLLSTNSDLSFLVDHNNKGKM